MSVHLFPSLSDAKIGTPHMDVSAGPLGFYPMEPSRECRQLLTANRSRLPQHPRANKCDGARRDGGEKN